ncbi:MAG: hypothetical protein ABI351_01525, partial [Herbaspirillum sp.]
MIRGHRGRIFLNKHAPVTVQKVSAGDGSSTENGALLDDDRPLENNPATASQLVTASNVIAFPQRKLA